jgi:hypothetical protein
MHISMMCVLDFKSTGVGNNYDYIGIKHDA